jgi:hypothetical protein
MSSDRPPLKLHGAALRAFSANGRRQPVADLVEDTQTKADSSTGAASRRWCFAADDLRIELDLAPSDDGWVATTRVVGESAFEVTVFRSETPDGSFESADGESDLGVLQPGPLSLTIQLPDGREVQSSWTTLPRIRTGHS